MRRSCLPGILVLAILAVVGVIYMLSQRGERMEAEVPAGGAGPAVAGSESSRPIGAAVSRPYAPAGAERKEGGAPEADDDALRRELDEARVELEIISRPLHEDVRSSTVNAMIEEGEALVTGGYRTADGNYELTFLTPRAVTLEDGREAIEVSANIVSVGADFVANSGLETLATNARNTLQHAEAWGQEEAAATLASLDEYETAQLTSAPRVVAIPGQSFSVFMGRQVPVPTSQGGFEFKDFGYTLEGTVARSEDGNGFSIRSRIERTGEEE